MLEANSIVEKQFKIPVELLEIVVDIVELSEVVDDIVELSEAVVDIVEFSDIVVDTVEFSEGLVELSAAELVVLSIEAVVVSDAPAAKYI